MRAFRFLHAADLHLDSPFKGLSSLPETIRETIRESTFTALWNLIDLAIVEQVDFVVFAGDIYDGADRSLRAQLRFQRAVERLAERGIASYVVHGNHDPDDGRKARLVWPDKVRFFSSKEVEWAAVENRQGQMTAQVHGISFASSAVKDNLAALYKVNRQDVFNIGLLHGNIDGDEAHDNYAPCTLRQLIGSGFQYWALGHIHSRRVLSEAPWVVYPGNIQGRSVREVGPRGCYIVDVSENGQARLQFHAIDQVRWFVQKVSIEGLTTEQQLRDELAHALEGCGEQAEGRSAVVRLVVEGKGQLHRVLQSGNALQELGFEFREEQQRRLGGEPLNWVWLESIQLRTGLKLDRQQLLLQDGFLSDLLASTSALMENESELRAYCIQALEALLSHAKAGKLLAELLEDEKGDWLRAAEELALGLIAEEEGWDA
ncbi:MAG: repair exonuclease [Paenibacillus sp.]|jgi:DNA repair exonuclease SbcCD nuclease subunit|nr:repair exonuclease [Paenibacillus sp.]